ncbi:MAG: methyl-accepting chemotaxis protein, partial [Planctomycetota bacterium]
ASISKTTDLVGEIAAASQEQAQGIDQVNTAVAQMDKVTQQNAANAEESASASEQLSAQAGSLQEMVQEFTLTTSGRSSGYHQNVRTRPVATAAPAGRTLGASDHTFHQIAAKPAGPQKAQTKVAAEKAIPLNDSEDLSDFNS